MSSGRSQRSPGRSSPRGDSPKERNRKKEVKESKEGKEAKDRIEGKESKERKEQVKEDHRVSSAQEKVSAPSPTDLQAGTLQYKNIRV